MYNIGESMIRCTYSGTVWLSRFTRSYNCNETTGSLLCSIRRLANAVFDLKCFDLRYLT